EEVTVTGDVTGRDARAASARVAARTDAEGDCGLAEVTLPAGSPTPANVAMYPKAPLPAERPPASRELLSHVDVLGTPETTYDADIAAAWLEKVGDPLPVYRGPRAWVHPAFYLDQANRALDRNVRVGPWIHVESRVRRARTRRARAGGRAKREAAPGGGARAVGLGAQGTRIRGAPPPDRRRRRPPAPRPPRRPPGVFKPPRR